MFARLTAFSEVRDLVLRAKPRQVSFDLFDTLIYRTVIEPRDVFRVQGRQLRKTGLIALDPEEWLRRRKAAEHRLSRALAPGEVCLPDIYDRLEQEGLFADAAAREAAMQQELAVERAVIRIFPGVPELLRAIKQTGVRIVILSDTYLPEEFVREQVAPILPWVDALHCSSATQQTKRHGHAFTVLKGQGRTLHFGDNRRSDRSRAWLGGVDGRWIVSPRQDWIGRNRPVMDLLRLRGVHTPPLPDPVRPPVPDSLEDLAVRWAIVLYDFLLDLRRQAKLMGATDIWLGSRDCESLWHVLQQRPGFFGDARVQYVRVSRRATHALTAFADPARYARWTSDSNNRADERTAALARQYYQAQLRPETRKILFVDMISKGRLERSLRLALPLEILLSACYFSLQACHEASRDARVYVPFRHDLLHASAIEIMAGFSEGTCCGFEVDAEGRVCAQLAKAPGDRAPEIYLAVLRKTLGMLLDADTGKEQEDTIPTAEAIVGIRQAIVRSLAMFPNRAMAQAMRGWRYCSPHHLPGCDIVEPRAGRVKRLLALASRDNPWPSIAVHSVAPPWLARGLQWLAVGRMKIKNSADFGTASAGC